MKGRILVGTCLLLAASGCADPPGEGADDQGAGAPATDSPPSAGILPGSLPCEGLESAVLAAPITRADLRGALGAPDSVAASTEPNRHIPGAVDSLFTLAWPGLDLQLRVPPNGKELPVRLEATTNRALAHPWVGVAPERVEAILGPATRRTQESLVYDCGLGASQPVTFRLAGGAVTGVVVSFYVD